jgi:hypothetical protein
MEDQIFGFNVPKPESKRLDAVQIADILGLKCDGFAPYPWCRGNPTVKDCIRLGYCARDPNCGE